MQIMSASERADTSFKKRTRIADSLVQLAWMSFVKEERDRKEIIDAAGGGMKKFPKPQKMFHFWGGDTSIPSRFK